MTFHTVTAIAAELAREGHSVWSAFDALTSQLIGTRKTETGNHVQFGFDRNLSATFLVAQSTLLVNRVITHSLAIPRLVSIQANPHSRFVGERGSLSRCQETDRLSY